MLIGPYTIRPCMIVLGYLVPSYKTYKALSAQNQQLLKFWCTYWVLLGLFLGLEWAADSLFFWLPLYYEAKLLFVVYLWHERTMGAVTVYERVLLPLLRTHEASIDSTIQGTTARLTDGVARQLGRVRDVATQNTASFIEAARKFSETGPNQRRPNFNGQ